MELAIGAFETKEGKKRISIWINEDDSIVLRNAVDQYLDNPPDPDDNTMLDRVKEAKLFLHELWKILHPS